MDATEFVDSAKKAKALPVYVVTGDEEFLRKRALAAIQRIVIGDFDPALCVAAYPVETDFSHIRNELNTLPFLSEARLVIIEQADSFVTKFRAQLEKYVAQPAEKGVLVLDVKSWNSGTNLAKAIPENATIQCRGPKPYHLPDWCVRWALSEYEKKLPKPAAQMLVELVGDQMSLLDSEIHKLAIYVDPSPLIRAEDVDRLVGRNRGANVFRILDAIGEGNGGEAIRILGELFEQGDDGVKVLGALGFQLRRIAMVARLHKQGLGLENAMNEAGIKPWPQVRDSLRRQMKHLGWSRMDLLYDWLIEADLGLKGGSPLPERVVMESCSSNWLSPSRPNQLRVDRNALVPIDSRRLRLRMGQGEWIHGTCHYRFDQVR